MMTHKDEQYLELGRMVAGMISAIVETLKVEGREEDVAYGRRRVTFPGGSVELFVVKGKGLADGMEATAAAMCDVESTMPPGEVN